MKYTKRRLNGSTTPRYRHEPFVQTPHLDRLAREGVRLEGCARAWPVDHAVFLITHTPVQGFICSDHLRNCIGGCGDDAARRGGRRYYVQPICSPTRSALMSGRYTYRRLPAAGGGAIRAWAGTRAA